MISIAREILFHDKLRFTITVASLGFAIVMIVYDIAMFYGVTSDSVALIDRSGADLWGAEEEARLNAPSEIPHRVAQRARSLEGVQQACALDFSVGNLKIDSTSQVQIVGIDPACPMFQPWSLISGNTEDLRRKDTIIIDDLALRNGSQASLGEEVELNGQDLRLVAITQDNKSFSYPFVYVNLDTFEKLTGNPGMINFVAVQLEPGANLQQIQAALSQSTTDLTITPTQAFRSATINGMIAQGVGMIFVIVFIGILVGMLTITLTMYTATMEQLRDFAILKALGATRLKIWGIVLEQTVTQTVAGFAIGLGASLGVDWLVESASGIRGQFPIPAITACFMMMIVLSILGSLISIRKASQVDPVIVFRA